MSRSGGQSEGRPQVFKSRSKLGTHLSTHCSTPIGADLREQILKLGPYQSEGNFQKGAKGRSFSSSYYSFISKAGQKIEKKWLCYSTRLHVAYCQIVRVQYFVRGGFVRHRSRASSKHLSPHLQVDQLDSSGGQTGVALHLQMHVWVSGPQRKPTRCCCFREVTLQLSPSLIELFR
ncbi:hypothetical protein TNCV_96411 [Trichonephila clavipes]|nr:hypothetical protein TNCV_96411 [Trichonephila clavipes]